MTELLKVRNPRSGESDYEICVAGDADIAKIAGELRANQRGWRDAGLEFRIETLQSFRDAIESANSIVLTLRRGGAQLLLIL